MSHPSSCPISGTVWVALVGLLALQQLTSVSGLQESILDNYHNMSQWSATNQPASSAVYTNDDNHNRQFLSPFGDVTNLSEMPLDALLRVKKSISEIMRNKQSCPPPGPAYHHQYDAHERSVNRPHQPIVNGSVMADNLEQRSLGNVAGLIDRALMMNANNKNVQTYALPSLDAEAYNVNAKMEVGSSGAGAGNYADNGIRKTFQLADHSHDHHEDKSKKIQKVFQFSITALAFLAFGGYLLCMIVQAIKSKGNFPINIYRDAISSGHYNSVKL